MVQKFIFDPADSILKEPAENARNLNERDVEIDHLKTTVIALT